jgi:hypothetical protein
VHRKEIYFREIPLGEVEFPYYSYASIRAANFNVFLLYLDSLGPTTVQLIES